MFEAFLRLLDKEQADYAQEALTSPRGREGFDYGYAVGVYAGLGRARELLDSMLRDREAVDNNL